MKLARTRATHRKSNFFSKIYDHPPRRANNGTKSQQFSKIQLESAGFLILELESEKMSHEYMCVMSRGVDVDAQGIFIKNRSFLEVSRSL